MLNIPEFWDLHDAEIGSWNLHAETSIV